MDAYTSEKEFEVKILVVDDDSLTQMLEKTFLKELGFREIFFAKDGIEALHLIPQIMPLDLILLDWHMPKMSGLELLKKLHQSHTYAKTKIILVTAEIDTAKVVEALEAGADEYIMKPFSQDMLAHKLEILGLWSSPVAD